MYVVIHTLEIGHKRLGAAIQSVDDHLPLGWACDFDASVLQAGSRWGTVPGRLGANMGSLRGEVERHACIETRLSCLAGSKKTVASCVERSMKGSQKLNGAVSENFCLCLGSN